MKKIIHTTNAPAPIGPYSQAVMVENVCYLSGQVAIDPVDGQLKIETLEIETRQAMKNIREVLKAANMDFSNIAKTSIFLKNMNDFAEINDIYAEYFKSDPPARETVEVARLPKDVNVEISVIAIASKDVT